MGCQPYPGTLAFRHCGQSFPKQHGTIPVDVAVPFHAGDEARVRKTVEERTSAKAAFQKNFKQTKAKAATEKDELEATKSYCRQRSQQSRSHCVATSQTLQMQGPWVCLPSRGADMVMRSVSVQDICKQDSTAAVDPLSKAWRKRHLGLPKAEPKKVSGLKLPACLAEGLCHCYRSPQQRKAAKSRSEVKKAILQVCTMHKHDSNSLMSGNVVLLWTSKSCEGTFQYRLTSVSHMSLKPWRPTFLNMRLVDKERESFMKIVQDDCERTMDQYFSLRVSTHADGTPSLSSYLELLSTLELSQEWYVQGMFLSQRHTPFPGQRGIVKACLPRNGEVAVAISAEMAQSGRDAAHDVLAAVWGDGEDDEPKTDEESEPGAEPGVVLAAAPLESLSEERICRSRKEKPKVAPEKARDDSF